MSNQRISFNIRLTPQELKGFKKSIKDLENIESLSDLFRTSAKLFIEQENPLGDTTLDDTLQAILQEFRDTEKRVMKEIQTNRSYLITIQENMIYQTKLESERMQDFYMDTLEKKWLSNPTELQTYTTIEDLEESVKEDHLRDVVIDTLDKLRDLGKVAIRSNQLRWNL